MKKKIILRGIWGFPMGLAIGYAECILISLCRGGGYYSPCSPALSAVMGNEINAVIVQALLCGLIGVSFAASSVIWDIEHWSLIKQTVIYFLINAIIMMPAAYFLYWMERSIKGFLTYFTMFALIFIIVWLISFAIARYNVRRMNENLNKIKN